MKHDRIYLSKTDSRVFIDTYIADPLPSKEGKRPAILVIPGGGYGKVCSDREGEPIALEFFSRGYNAFVLGYRVGTDTDLYPAQLLDAGSAMIYIKEHSDELFVDEGRVFAVGFSAGGHLCASLATMFDYPEVKAELKEKAPLIKPKGVILSYPVTTAYGPTHEGSFVKLLGKPYPAITEDERKKFSIDAAITPDSAPMFLWHTAEDDVVPIDGTLRVAAALTKNGVPYRLSVFPYGPHGVALANDLTRCGREDWVQPLAQEWTEQADAWMKTL